MMSRGLWLLWFVLWEGDPTFTAAPPVYSKSKGEDQSVKCWWNTNRKVTRRVFCKNDCAEKDILVQTLESKQINGRYSIEHEKKGSPLKDYIYVKISNVTLTDSGRYRCSWETSGHTEYAEFRTNVTDGVEGSVVSLTAGEDFSRTCYFYETGKRKTFCRDSCSERDILVATTGDEAQSSRYKIQYNKYAEDLTDITVTIKNLSSADSGVYQCLLDKKSKKFSLSVASATTSTSVPVTVTTGTTIGHDLTAATSIVPVTVTTEATIEQDLTEELLNSSEPPMYLPMILSHILWFVVLSIVTAILIICYKRRISTDPGTDGAEGQMRKCENVCPESENIYQNWKIWRVR